MKRDNEPAWVYLNGMLALSDEDELKSQKTSAKRVHIKHFIDYLLPWITENLSQG